MCGITGVIAFTEKGKESFSLLSNSLQTLAKRGPDGEGKYIHNNVALGHRRLAIIDTSAVANQPFTDASGRYTIIFNGEFFNFKEHRDKVKDYQLRSTSDTEVLLYLYIKYGAACLEFINGFFALAIYDNVEEKTFIARDRMGIKPLLIYKESMRLYWGLVSTKETFVKRSYRQEFWWLPERNLTEKLIDLQPITSLRREN